MKTELPIDKVVHFIEYGILGFLLFNSLRSFDRLRIWQIIIIVISFGAILGALDESYQRLTKRTSSIYDWFADVSGVTVSVICIVLYLNSKVFKKIRFKTEKPS